MNKTDYDLMLGKINSFISGIPDDNDELLFSAVDLKSAFMELFGDD
jgi:hypothetical protein